MNAVLTETLRKVRINSTAQGPVFCNRNGTPYRSFRTAFKRAARQAGLTDLTFHDLWHTFTSRLVMRGVDLPTVQALMGHKDITMTLRYTHWTTDHKQCAVRVLGQCGTESPHFSPQGEDAGTVGQRNTLKIRALS